jgi:glycosyltransferase involved in cell wall biosynthesis
MKILYLITKGERGGAQSHLWDLMRLHRSGTPFLALGEDGFLGDQARQAGIPVRLIPHFVHRVHPRHDLLALRELIRVIQAERPDLIHAHTAKAGMLARVAGIFTRTPAVYTVHAWSFNAMRSPLARAMSVWLERGISRLNQPLIDVSQFNFKLAEREGVAPRDNHLVIWNGVADTPHRASFADNGGVTKIIMVARFAPPKDQILLLEALAPLPRNWRCTFVGDGPDQPRAIARARALGIEEYVRFLGDRDDVSELLSESHLFVLCSHSESLPISILEAMRAGLPVISSAVGGCAELVIDKVTGLLTKAGDVNELRGHIAELLASWPLLESLGREGRARFEAHFRVERMIQQTDAAYAQIMRRSFAASSASVAAPEFIQVQGGKN